MSSDPAPTDRVQRQHHAQPPSPPLTPDSSWSPPQPLPETGNTPAPLISAAGITLLMLGVAWPSVVAGALGATLLVVGLVLWLSDGLASWRAWLRDHPEENS